MHRRRRRAGDSDSMAASTASKRSSRWALAANTASSSL